MPRLLRSLAVAAAFCLAVSASEDAVAAGLTLQLHDGSQLTVDAIAAASESTLTVAVATERIRIERTLPWNRIASARLEEESYSSSELKLALGLSPGESDFVSQSLPVPVPPQPDFTPGMPVDHHGSFGAVAAPPFFAPPAYAGGSPCGCGAFAPCLVSCSPVPLEWLAFRPIGRVIGVRPDPLSAYADLAPAIYPGGIPTTEAPFALGLLRERRWLEAIAPVVGRPVSPDPIGPLPLPLPPLPAGDVVPGQLSQIEARVTPLRPGGGADVSALGVTIFGLDAAGRPVAVNGSAQFTLFAGRQRLVRAFADVYAAKPTGLDRLGHWTRQVHPDASLVLRLADPLPDHDPTVSPLGSLRVRLTVPGQGVFETIAEPIELRPASPLRDAIRSENGSRFLPHEKTTGRRIDTWPHRPDLVGRP